MVCEKCWSEYRCRLMCGEDVVYSQVVAESDARGGCTPEEQCGENHLILGDACRCGKVRGEEMSE